jgi:hypothetical protein
MTEQTIKFRDPVVQCVVNKFVDRSDVGYAKYGKTMRDDHSDIFVWLNHLQEELMDATLYLQRLKEEISSLREEKELLNSIHDIDVIEPEYVKPPPIWRANRGDEMSFTIDEDDEYEHKDWKDLLMENNKYKNDPFIGWKSTFSK